MNFKKTTFIIFIFLFIFLNLTIIYGTNVTKYNIENYFRIHIVANSDNIDDQIIKYTVAKEVTKYIDTITKDSTSKKQSKQIITCNIQNILEIANNVLTQNNAAYGVRALIGNIKYDQKTMNNITMNEGIYDSLKIVLGSGNGQNFWSLIFPQSISSNNQDIFNEGIQYSLKIKKIFKSLIEKISEI